MGSSDLTEDQASRIRAAVEAMPPMTDEALARVSAIVSVIRKRAREDRKSQAEIAS